MLVRAQVLDGLLGVEGRRRRRRVVEAIVDVRAVGRHAVARDTVGCHVVRMEARRWYQTACMERRVHQ